MSDGWDLYMLWEERSTIATRIPRCYYIPRCRVNGIFLVPRVFEVSKDRAEQLKTEWGKPGDPGDESAKQ